MRFNSILMLVPLFGLALANPQEEDAVDIRNLILDRQAASIAVREAEPLEVAAAAAACKKNGCKCQKVKQGQYCGLCTKGSDFTVTKMGTGGEWDHVYECSKTGSCCDYGYAKDCHSGDKMRCG